MKRIFIVEDEISICKELKELLVTEGYEADYIKSFDNTLEDIIAFNPDLVLLDINIPNINGKLILRGIRKKSDVPVIMLTSKTEESARWRALLRELRPFHQWYHCRYQQAVRSG